MEPQLSSNLKSGGTFSPHKNARGGRAHGRRMLVGERFELSVSFPEASPSVRRVVLHTNLPGGVWADLPMAARGGGFHVTLEAQAMGLYQAQVRWELGDKTYIDADGYMHLAVDGPLVGNLRLYTMIPTATGKISDWVEEIPHIKEMGFNAVHLLPVTAMDASLSPYSARDLFSVDPLFLEKDGGLDGFRRFVGAVKSAGLHLCVDLVLNHLGITSDLAKTHPEYFRGDGGKSDGFKRAGAADGGGWTEWSDLALLDFDNPDPLTRQGLWDHMTAYARLWAGFADETGGMIRLDNLHSTHPGFLAHVLRELRTLYPNLSIFSELFAAPKVVHDMVWSYQLNLCLATPWTAPYAYQVRGQLAWLHQQTGVRYLFPLASHDSGAPAQEYGGVEATAARMLVAALFSTGATGAVQGNEDGYPVKMIFIGGERPPEYARDMELRALFTNINKLHESDPIFRTAGNLRFVDADHGAVLAAVRKREGRQVLLIANLDPRGAHPLTLSLDDLAPGRGPGPLKARDLFNGFLHQWEGSAVTFQVPAGAAWAIDLLPGGT